MKALLLAVGALFCPPEPVTPPPDDLNRFPPPETVTAALEWADRQKAALANAAGAEREDPEFWSEWIEDLEEATETWLLLAQLQCPEGYYGEGYCRTPDELRARLGDDAYAAGRMPALNVPPRRLYAPWRR